MKKTILAVLMASSFLLCYAAKKDDAPAARKRLLTSVGALLEQRHYLSPTLDDAFSRNVWDTYLGALDTRKYILLQIDVDTLKKYRDHLDDELHGDSIQFFPAAMDLYARRYKEVVEIYSNLLSVPVVFNPKDSIGLGAQVTFPGDETERIRRWKKDLQYRVLDRLTELQEQRTQCKPGDTLYRKTDAQLEKMARENLRKQYDRMYERFKSYNTDRLFTIYLNTIAHVADPHTDYFPPQDKQAFDQVMANRFSGIGAQLREEEDGSITIAEADAGGPLWKSGLLTAGDKILKIGQGKDGPMTDVTGMDLPDAIKLIRGEQGSVVRLECRKKNGGIITVPLVREEIKTAEMLARSAVIWKDGKKTGYIYLPVFYDDFGHADGAHCADDVAKEIIKLKNENVSGIILDLRNNGGGSLAQVVKMAGLFIGRGPVVQVHGRGTGEVLQNEVSQPLYDGPLTVMVNALSASASEIFAAAIQDYQRGIIIGSTTLGKGTVQQPLPLAQETDGALKLTIRKFYRVNGGSTQLKGVIPDVSLPDTWDPLGVREGNKPFAMDWDRLQPAPFTPEEKWNITAVADAAALRITNNKVFNTLQQNNAWIETYLEEKAHPMLLSRYKKQLLEHERITQQNEKMVQLPETQKLDLRATQGASGVPYERWIKKSSTDVYIEQALLVSLGLTK